MNLRRRTFASLNLTLLAAAALAVLAPPAHADVTVAQKTSMSLAGLNIDVNSTERTSDTKQRNDSTVECHGFLAFFCHDVESGHIVRLDKQLEWQLQPQKKSYTERPFPTPEQRAAAQKAIEDEMEELKKCPLPQSPNASPSAPDTSNCQLSSPVVNVTATDEHATIVGHDARKTQVVMSQTCTDTQTGDVCEIDYGFETWLTTDVIPGTGERNAFARKYLAAQGLDPNDPRLQRTMQQFMAPYAAQLKQLQGKAGDLKGYPLRTTFYMAFGGPHCGKAKQAAQQQQAASSNPFSMHNIASHAFASGLGGLFHHGASAISTNSAGGEAASDAANSAADPTANAAANAVAPQQPSSGATPTPAPAPGALVRAVSFTTETTSIDTTSISPDQFEIPTDWKLEPQPVMKTSTQKCPTASK